MWAAEGQLDSVAQWQYSPPPPLLRRGATLEAVWLAEKPELSWLSISNCRSSTQQGDQKVDLKKYLTLQTKIQQTKMLVTCKRFGDLFLFRLVWFWQGLLQILMTTTDLVTL